MFCARMCTQKACKITNNFRNIQIFGTFIYIFVQNFYFCGFFLLHSEKNTTFADEMKHLPSLYSLRRVAGWLCAAGRHYRIQMILNVLVGISHVAFGLLTVWFSKELIDSATAGAFSLRYAALLALVMLLDVACVYAIRWIRAMLGVRSENGLRLSLYNRLLRSDYRRLLAEHSGSLTSRLTTDVSTVSRFLSEQVPQLITALLQFAGAFVFLAVMEWRLAVVIVVVTPAMLLVAQFYIRKMRKFSHELRDQEAGIQSFVQETVQHSLLVKALNRVPFVSDNLAQKQADYQAVVKRNTRYSSLAQLLVNLSFVSGYLIAFFWGAYRLSLGVIGFGALMAFVQLVGQIQGPIRTLTNYVTIFVQTFTATDRLLALETTAPAPSQSSIINQKSPIKNQKSSITNQKSPIKNLQSSIFINNLSFAYRPEQPILSHFSVTIPAGSRTAIVGKTGIGKTTLISLLLGLLKPDEGTISMALDGEPTPTDCRYFAYVPQGNTLMSGTIRDNLRYGNPDASDAEMLQALEMADAQFVTENEKGLDMSCGERGTGLSEGQAQRVSIARALLVPAPVLLLDEAFSALDNPTALGIMERLSQQGRTILYITHRESLLPLATQVIELT